MAPPRPDLDIKTNLGYAYAMDYQIVLLSLWRMSSRIRCPYIFVLICFLVRLSTIFSCFLQTENDMRPCVFCQSRVDFYSKVDGNFNVLFKRTTCCSRTYPLKRISMTKLQSIIVKGTSTTEIFYKS